MQKPNEILPLLLLDDQNILELSDQGVFKCSRLSFDEAKAIIEMHHTNDIVCCFTHPDIETIIFDYLHIQKRDYSYIKPEKMEPGQDAIAFKLYTTQSETKPIIHAEGGIEAKKIQNIYVYCQLFSRIE